MPPAQPLGVAGQVHGAAPQRPQLFQMWALFQGEVPVVFGLVSDWLGPCPVLEEQHMAEKK